MQFFKFYLKQRGSVLLIFLLFALVFLVSFCLYHLPPAAVLYPALLCLGAGLVLAALDLRRLHRRHRELQRLLELPPEVLSEETASFPPALSLEEADYQQLIRRLLEEERQCRTDSDRRFQEMIEYYTLWAHQIKTPISSMRLHLQNEDSPLSRRLSLDLLRIEQYAEMVMVFLRLDSPDTDYVIRRQELDPILRGAVKKFAGEFIDRRLTLNYEPVQLQVVTDEKWLSFVIEQLLSNALKYTPSGSITIRPAGPGRLVICDTGIGISPEDLPRIFEKGFTGCNGRQDKRASGIGLYLCRRILTNLGHGIDVQSTPGKGTCFYLDFSREPVQFE